METIRVGKINDYSHGYSRLSVYTDTFSDADDFEFDADLYFFQFCGSCPQAIEKYKFRSMKHSDRMDKSFDDLNHEAVHIFIGEQMNYAKDKTLIMVVKEVTKDGFKARLKFPDLLTDIIEFNSHLVPVRVKPVESASNKDIFCESDLPVDENGVQPKFEFHMVSE